MPGAPAEVALAVERRLSRRFARGAAWLAAQIVGPEGDARVPHSLAWRLRQYVKRVGPRTVVYGGRASDGGRRHVLLISHELSRSGAPQLLFEIAKVLIARGDEVTVGAPLDGGLREALVEAGATVIVSEAVRQPASELLAALAKVVDAAICNTIATDGAVEGLAPKVPLIWYVHEVSLLEELLAAGPRLARVLSLPAQVWAGSELPAGLIRPHRSDVRIVPYGLDPLPHAHPVAAGAADRPLQLAVFGSFEPRKGQDLLVEAVGLLAPAVRGRIHLTMYGRVLFPEFHAQLCARAAQLAQVTLGGELDRDGYREAVQGCDAVVVCSRDDTLPLVSLDALGAGRLLICTRTTGTAAYLDSGHNGFVAATPTAQALAATLTEAVARAQDWGAIAEEGRQVFARHFSKSVFAEVIATELAAITRARAPGL